MSDITYEMVREFFIYDPETGELRNRIDRVHAKAGELAGYSQPDGYKMVKFKGKRRPVARLIWLYMTGDWPENEIDHVNVDCSDNRWCNLRDATRSQNCANKSRFFKANSFGYRGVKRASMNKYNAVICVGQKEYTVGRYPTAEIAALAYDVAAVKRHGEFARLNFPEKKHRDWIVP